LGALVAPVLCLEVQGTRVVAGGGTAPITAHTCGFYHPLPPFVVSGFAVVEARALPVLPMGGVRPDGLVGTVGHYSPWASGRAPRSGATSLVVHFAAGRWDETVAALQEGLGGLRETAVVVAVLFPDGELERASRARIETEAAFLVGEDLDGQWADTFGVSGRPATVLVDPRGAVAWREEGALSPAKLAKALKQHATAGGRVSWQLLRMGVAAGDTPPEFLFRIGRGAELSMRRMRGRRVAVTFWAGWCDPSMEQLREFARAYEATRGDGPLVLAVGDGEDEHRAAQVAKEEGLPFPVLPDPDRAISRRFGVGCWPSTVWIGPTMRVEAVNFGLTAVAERSDGGADGGAGGRPDDGYDDGYGPQGYEQHGKR
jgi:peroxiredoxin